MGKPDSQAEASPARSFSSEATSYTTDPDCFEDEVCWICLEGDGRDLVASRCACPRRAHLNCLARWQLQSAGTSCRDRGTSADLPPLGPCCPHTRQGVPPRGSIRLDAACQQPKLTRETHCEFCDQSLPDWKRTMTPNTGSTAPAIMNVSFGNAAFSFEVEPGPAGYEEFSQRVRQAFGLPDDSDLNITFTCDEPCEPANQLTLQGRGAFDAAVHCASVSAARRVTRSQSCTDASFHSLVPALPGTPSSGGLAPGASDLESVDAQHLVAVRHTQAHHRRAATVGGEGVHVSRLMGAKPGDGRPGWLQGLMGLLGCRR